MRSYLHCGSGSRGSGGRVRVYRAAFSQGPDLRPLVTIPPMVSTAATTCPHRQQRRPRARGRLEDHAGRRPDLRTVGGVNVVSGLPALSLQTTVSVLHMSQRLLLESTDYGGEPRARARCGSVRHRGSPKRCSRSDVPPYILLVITHTKYTGVRQKDSNV